MAHYRSQKQVNLRWQRGSQNSTLRPSPLQAWQQGHKHWLQHLQHFKGPAMPSAGHDNAKILRDLFEGTGVLSALDHSKIEGANDPEARAVDYQASRVARQAAEALRLSRQECQQVG